MTRIRILIIFLLLWCGLAELVAAEVCSGSKVPKAEREAYDAQATLTAAEIVQALQTHLPYGQPPCPMLLPSQAYIVCYSPAHRLALWAAYQLKAEDLQERARRDAFRSDPRLNAEENAACADYKDSGYDRGHIVPNGDMGRSAKDQANTFFLSNMAPQTPALNRGLWRYFEDRVRTYVQRLGSLHLVTGSILPEPAQTVPSGRVTIPTRFFKILLRSTPTGRPAILAVQLPNLHEGLPVPPGTRGVQGQTISAEAADAFLAAHTVSVKEIEHLTGLDLLPTLDAEPLKREVARELWARN